MKENEKEKKDSYVYLLVDKSCKTDGVFYVGKGTGARVFEHVKQAKKCPDRKDDSKIGIINSCAQNVEHVILRSNMDEETAFEVEAAVIDLLKSDYISLKHEVLTNKQTGHGSKVKGIRSIEGGVHLKKKMVVLQPNVNYIALKIDSIAKDRNQQLSAEWSVDYNVVHSSRYVLLEDNNHVLDVYESGARCWNPVEGTNNKKCLFVGKKVTDEKVLKKLLGCQLPPRSKGAGRVRMLNSKKIETYKTKQKKESHENN